MPGVPIGSGPPAIVSTLPAIQRNGDECNSVGVQCSMVLPTTGMSYEDAETSKYTLGRYYNNRENFDSVM